MTEYEILQLIKTIVDDKRYDKLAETYLDIAESAIIGRLYPLVDGKTWDDVPEKYHVRAAEIAVALINKRGAEGEMAHRENGTSRTYESAYIPKSLLADIVPFAGVPR